MPRQIDLSNSTEMINTAIFPTVNFNAMGQIKTTGIQFYGVYRRMHRCSSCNRPDLYAADLKADQHARRTFFRRFDLSALHFVWNGIHLYIQSACIYAARSGKHQKCTVFSADIAWI